MRSSIRRVSPAVFLTLFASVFAVSCLTDPSGGVLRDGYLALAPSFESSAASIVEVDSVHVVLTRVTDGEVALDTVIALTTDSNTVDLSLSVPISSSSEEFTLVLECISPTGEVVFSAGPLQVTATTSSSDDVVAEDVPVTYVGVGSNAADIDVPDADIYYIHMGDTLTVEAQALDSSGAPIIGTPIKWTSLDTTMLRFPDPAAGRMVAGQIRGPVQAKAELLTGPADIFDVYVEPVPNEISIFSGDGQRALVGTELPVVLEVQVNAPDGPVEGSPVDFTTNDGGSFSAGSTITNAEGYAWTNWTLGEIGGEQTATATVRNWPDLQAVFTATAVYPVMQSLRFTAQPSNADAGAVITPAVVVTASNTLGDLDTNFTGNVALGIASNPSNGRLSGTTTVAAVGGVATFDDLSIDAGGTGYTLEATAANYQPATSAPFDITGTAPATGATITWTGAGDGASWSDANNWDLARIPAALDTVLITQDVASRVELASDATVARLTIGAAGNTNTQWLNIQATGSLRVDSSAVVDQRGSLYITTGGAYTGMGDLSVAGSLLFWRGKVTGPGSVTVESGGTFSISPTVEDTTVIDGTTISNNGTFEWSGGVVVLDNGAQIVNNSTMDITSDDLMFWAGNGTTPQLVNNGTIQRTIVGSVTSIAVDFVSNTTSTLQIVGGSIVFSRDASFVGATIQVGDDINTASIAFAGTSTTIDAASVVTVGGDGLVQFLAGSATISGSYNYSGSPNSTTSIGGGTVTFNNTTTAVIPNLVVNGGTLAGTGNIQVAAVFSWTGGSVEGSGAIEINTGSTGSIGGTGLTWSERVLNNEGTIYLNGTGPTLSNGAVINNLSTGIIDFLGEYSIFGAGTLNNNGTLVKSVAGAGPSRIELAIVNSDTIDVQDGTLAFYGAFSHMAGALLRGSGTFDFTNTTTLQFEGDVAPGTSPGILNFIDNATMGAQSTAYIEIGGLTAGTDYDRATVTGSFTAGGTLDISLINSFRPTIGDQFTILTHALGRSGTFDNIVGLDLGGGIEFDTVWTATSLVLETVAAAVPQIVFAGDSAGSAIGLFTANPDGTSQANNWYTGTLGNQFWYPRWSPDRERIVLGFGASGSTNLLYIMSAAADTVSQIVSDTSALRPRWSPNGIHLAFECATYWGGNPDVCVIADVTAAIGSIPRNNYGFLTDFDTTNWPTGPGSFAWNPAVGDQIAVVRDSVPPTGGSGQSMIFKMRYDGTEFTRLRATGVLDVGNGPLRIVGPMDWSQDGSLIAFAAEDPSFERSIYIVNWDGTGLTRLTSGTGNLDAAPVFSPDGTQIIFGRDNNCSYDIWMINTDATNEHQLTSEGVCDYPSSNFGYDWSPDGTEIVLSGFETPGVVGNLWVFVVPSSVTSADYESLRVPVGRTTAGTALFLQPSWRP